MIVRLGGMTECFQRCVVEFLRVNTWVKRWQKEVDFRKYTFWQSGYEHLQLDEKIKIIQKVHIPEITVCEDVTEHYQYWREDLNPNKNDCCNLQFTKEITESGVSS